MARVLIADDSPVARFSVSQRVRAAGFEVVESDSVASASKVDPSTLACALLDFDLGDGFGVDVAARLRARSGSLPIAFFTSSFLLSRSRGVCAPTLMIPMPPASRAARIRSRSLS